MEKTLVLSLDRRWAKIMDYNDWIRPDIQVHELVSRSSPEITLVDTDLLDVAQLARKKSGKPIIFACWHRSLSHNNEEGSKDTSRHVMGCAFDAHIPGLTSLEFRNLIVRCIKELGIKRKYYIYQIGPNSIHVDFRVNVDNPNGNSF